MQRSCLDAFLIGEDRQGWAVKGKVPPVSLVLRKGNIGVNNPIAEQAYETRDEIEWPIARTAYTKFMLTPEGVLTPQRQTRLPQKISCKALGTIETPSLMQFQTAPFDKVIEITGHITAHLNVSASPEPGSKSIPPDIDIFVTLRYISTAGNGVHYTDTSGEPVPLTKGWLRVSLRKADSDHHKYRPWLPYRQYACADVQPVVIGEVYAVDLEIWPTNVVVEKGGRIVFEVLPGDTRGCGISVHTDESDRPPAVIEGWNHLHFAEDMENYVVLPIIPPKRNGPRAEAIIR